MSFTPDKEIQKTAETYAQDACDFLRDHFKITLDWTDASIEHIEATMETFYRQLENARPSNEKVIEFSKMFGSYIGEVYRKNHGATWGIVEMNGSRFPGMKAEKSDTLFWPWGRARNRLLDGPENNVWHYYKELIKQH